MVRCAAQSTTFSLRRQFGRSSSLKRAIPATCRPYQAPHPSPLPPRVSSKCPGKILQRNDANEIPRNSPASSGVKVLAANNLPVLTDCYGRNTAENSDNKNRYAPSRLGGMLLRGLRRDRALRTAARGN